MENILLFHIPLTYYFIILTLLLIKIPIISKFFKVINTAVHELGHAIVSLLLSGKVQKIELFSNSEGVTVTHCSRTWKAFFVSLAGYPFASAASYFCFYLLSKGFEKELIIGFVVLFVLMLLLWIRNLYGFFWVIFFSGGNIALLYYVANPKILFLVALFYVTVLFTESLFSSLVILHLSFRTPQQAGDASNLRNYTHIPAWFWGVLFAASSCYMTCKTVIHFPIFFSTLNPQFFFYK